MAVMGLVTAVLVGLAIGALGWRVAPGRQHIPVWLACLVGVGCALLGTALATVLGVASARGIGLEVGLQVGLAAVGVMTLAGLYSRDVRA